MIKNQGGVIGMSGLLSEDIYKFWMLGGKGRHTNIFSRDPILGVGILY